MSQYRSNLENIVLIDNVGWGEPILGSVIGAQRIVDRKYMEERIPTSSFQTPSFLEGKYLDDATKIIEKIIHVMGVDKETTFKIPKGTILLNIQKYLKTRDYTVESVEETGELHQKVEESYLRWCREVNVPEKYLESEERFWKILGWVDENLSERAKLVKAGWEQGKSPINARLRTLKSVGEIIGGEEGAKIVAVLSHINEAHDIGIVAKTGIRLNTVRKILYKLYDHSLVGLRRTRDKMTGWFFFIGGFNLIRLMDS